MKTILIVIGLLLLVVIVWKLTLGRKKDETQVVITKAPLRVVKTYNTAQAVNVDKLNLDRE